MCRKGQRGRQFWDIHFGDRYQSAQDLIAQAEESEVSNTEPERNAESKAPMFHRSGRFGLGNWPQILPTEQHQSLKQLERGRPKGTSPEPVKIG